MSANPDFAADPRAEATGPFDLTFARDVLSGLAKVQKSIPCTWLYDHRGSELFEEITRVPEYYPTRTEIMILERCAAQIGELAGRGATVIELGSGSSRKTPLLLAALEAPALYVPVDISAAYLKESVHGLRSDVSREALARAAAAGGRLHAPDEAAEPAVPHRGVADGRAQRRVLPGFDDRQLRPGRGDRTVATHRPRRRQWRAARRRRRCDAGPLRAAAGL